VGLGATEHVFQLECTREEKRSFMGMLGETLINLPLSLLGCGRLRIDLSH
jgi:hypothetical protein